jgi:hypothetical protein
LALRADIWVAAYLRRASAEGAFAALRKRGSSEAGAIFVVVDRLDGRVALFEPAPSQEGERRWMRAHQAEWVSAPDVEARLQRQMKFDPDIWIVEAERPDGAHGLDLVNP